MGSDNIPPQLPLRFFRWFCHKDYLEDIEGDLMERFHQRLESKSLKTARRQFLFDVLRLFRPGIIRPLDGSHKLTHYGMFKNDLKVAFRVFKREKLITAINVSGLALGIWCVMLTALWVKDELSFDAFHERGDQIHRLMMNLNFDGENYTEESTSYPVGDALVADFPEITERVRYSYPEAVAMTVNDKLTEHELAAADPNFFEMFSFPLVMGNAGSCLNVVLRWSFQSTWQIVFFQMTIHLVM
jgi:hypothetical protein